MAMSLRPTAIARTYLIHVRLPRAERVRNPLDGFLRFGPGRHCEAIGRAVGRGTAGDVALSTQLGDRTSRLYLAHHDAVSIAASFARLQKP